MPLDPEVLKAIEGIPESDLRGLQMRREAIQMFREEPISGPPELDPGVLKSLGKLESSREQYEARIKARQAEQDRMTEFARGRLEEAWFPNLKATGVGIGASVVSPVARMLGQEEYADKVNRFAAAYQQAAAERDVEGVTPAWLKRGARGAATTLPSMVVAGAVAGPYGAINVAAIQEANRAITEGKDAGLTGSKLAGHAIRQGIIEGGVASLFQRAGLGGVEKMVGGRQAVAAGTTQALKRLGINTLHELPEEIITEIGHNVESAASGVDPEAMTTESLIQTAFDTTVQTLITMGAVGGPSILQGRARGKALKAREEIMAYAAEGKVPSRRKWREWGLPLERGETRRQRGEALRELAGHFQSAEIARFVASGETPSQEQWNRLGLPGDAAETEESRSAYLASRYGQQEPPATQSPAAISREQFMEERPPVEGYWYHGSPEGDVTSPDPQFISRTWREGAGFYVTESREAASQYARGLTATGERRETARDRGKVNYVQIDHNARFLDMEQPANLDLWDEVSGELGLAVDSSGDATRFPEGSNGAIHNALVEEYVDSFNASHKEAALAVANALEDAGFAGTTHSEGQKQRHRVRVLFGSTYVDEAGREVDTKQFRVVPPGEVLGRSALAEQQEAAGPEAPGPGGEPAVEPAIETAGRPEAQEEQAAERPEVDAREAVEQAPGEDPGFIRDSAGRVGIAADLFSRASAKAGRLLRRFLTSAGGLPESVFRLKVQKEGDVSRIQRQIAFTLKDYDRAVKQVYGGEIAEADLDAIDGALRGEISVDAIPEPLRGPVQQMRAQIDALSQYLIDIGAVQGAMAATVAKNLGVYITRSYRAFDDPNWARNVPAEIRNKATALLRSEFPGASEEEIQGEIEALLYEGKAAETPIALLSESHLGAKDLSILKRRRDIPPEIRALLGEYKDPRLNYARSVSKLGSLVANHLFLSDVRDAGLSGGFFSQQAIINDFGELKTRIVAGQDSELFPLDGLYTTPEIKEAFERAVSREQMPAWLRQVLVLNGSVKVAKTVLSLTTHVRNLLGNGSFAISNGHWRVGEAGTAFKGTMTSLFNLPEEQWRNYVLRAVELGLMEQDVHAGELRANIKDASAQGLEGFMLSAEQRRASVTRRVAKKLISAFPTAYQAEDNIWKLYAWENEKARYRKARPDLSEDEIGELTAEIVSNTYPTFSRVPEAVRQLRRFPLTGAFVSFPAEVIRTQYHTLKLAKQELSDPRTRAIGATRLAGTTLSLTLASGVAAAMRFLVGVSRDEDEKLRGLVPPWQTNSEFAHFGKAEDGIYRYVDLSYLDAKEYILKPFKAFLRGEDFKSGLWEGLREAGEPFAGEDILFKHFSEVWRNSKDGRPVYNEQDPVNEQAEDIAAHLWMAFEPGTYTSIQRVYKGIRGIKAESGRSYDPEVEAIAVITGQRINDLDVRQSLGYRMRDFQSNIRDVRRSLYSVTYNRGSARFADVVDAYRTFTDSRERVYGQMSKIATDVIGLGVPMAEVRRIMEDSGVPQKDIPYLLQGQVPPFEWTSQRLRSIQQANPDEARERIAAIMAARQAEGERVNALD